MLILKKIFDRFQRFCILKEKNKTRGSQVTTSVFVTEGKRTSIPPWHCV